MIAPAMTDDLLDIQLALEDLDRDEIRERARRLRLAIPPGRRLAISINICAALFRSRALTQSERNERVTAWCEGFGANEVEVLRVVNAILEREVAEALARSSRN
jgi:hypothetical protein